MPGIHVHLNILAQYMLPLNIYIKANSWEGP